MRSLNRGLSKSLDFTRVEQSNLSALITKQKLEKKREKKEESALATKQKPKKQNKLTATCWWR